MLHRLASVLAALAACLPAQEDSARPAPVDTKAVRLQATVDEMVALVEKHAGLAFERPPRVRATKHAEWRELVRQHLELESVRDVIEASLATLGLYLPDTDEIVLSPLVMGALLVELDADAPRHRREGIAHQKATIAHEIVHALQQQHWQLPARLQAVDDADEDEIRRLRFVIEGHAALVEERIAEQELGLDDFMMSGPYAGIGVDPTYVTGHRYFLHLWRTGGMAAVHAKLAEPPTLEELLELAAKPLPEAPREKPAAPAEGSSGTKR